MEGNRRKALVLGIARWLIRAGVLGLVAWGVWATVAESWEQVAREQERVARERGEVLRELEAWTERYPEGGPSDRQAELIERYERLEAEFAESQRLSWRELRPAWLIAAALLYLVAMLPMGWFWYRTLHEMGQRPSALEALRAFYIGHLGKYVPGKAMVVVLRTGLVRSERVDATVAATSVFVESMTMMAVGGMVAALILATMFADHPLLLLLAVAMMLATGLPTLPPVFRRLVRAAQVTRFGAHVEQSLDGLNYRLIASGWLVIVPGWFLMGISLWAVLKALERPGTGGLASELPLLTATVALALTAGFLSLIPGGIGVREGVVTALLAGPYGAFTAIIAAILLRVVWLAAELFAAGLLYAIRRPQPSRGPPR